MPLGFMHHPCLCTSTCFVPLLLSGLLCGAVRRDPDFSFFPLENTNYGRRTVGGYPTAFGGDTTAGCG